MLIKHPYKNSTKKKFISNKNQKIIGCTKAPNTRFFCRKKRTNSRWHKLHVTKPKEAVWFELLGLLFVMFELGVFEFGEGEEIESLIGPVLLLCINSVALYARAALKISNFK